MKKRLTTNGLWTITFLLCFLSNSIQAGVIWRTISNGGYTSAYVESQMTNQLNNSSKVTGTPIVIDIDLNGTSDLTVNYEIFDNGAGSLALTCSEGTVTYKDKIANWIFAQGVSNGNDDFLAGGGEGSILQQSTVSTMNIYNGRAGISFQSRRYITPYPGSTCNGSNMFTVTPDMILSGYWGVKFTRNGNIHMGWIRVENTCVTEVAWEEIPFFPIRIGSQVGLMNEVDVSHVVISGQVFVDANNNCIKDVSEAILPGVNVRIKNTSYTSLVSSEGYYALYIPYTSGSQYELEVAFNGVYGSLSSCTNVIVQSVSSGQAIVRNFAIIPSTCPNLRVVVNTLPLRRCFKSAFTVNYNNTGTSSAVGYQIKVVLPQWVKALSSLPAWTSRTSDTLVYQLASLAGLSSGQIIVTDSIVCNVEEIRNLDQCIKAIVVPGQTCFKGVIWTGPDVKISGVCESNTLKAKIRNEGGDMSDSLLYRIVLDKQLIKEAKYKLAANAEYLFDIPTSGKAIWLEVEQVSNHPVLPSRIFALEGCGLNSSDWHKGIIHTLPLIREGNTESTVCASIVDSFDPNDKSASPGEGIIEANQDIYYTVRFQNTGSAAAINIVVDDTLSDQLDISGLQVISTSHPGVMSTYVFHKNGNILLRFTFYNINLVTKSSSDILSQGYVTFKVPQKKDLTAGMIIKNKAFIYFDYNSTIITNETLHGIGESITDAQLKVVSGLQPQLACAGESISLVIDADNVEQYEWYKNDQLISGEDQASLSIAAISQQEEGIYICKVIGIMDTLTTSAAVQLKEASECQVTSVQGPVMEQFNLYPNPSKQEVFVQTECSGSYELHDVYGQLKKKGQFESGTFRIVGSEELNPGYYVIKFETGTETYSSSLIIQ